MTTFVKPFDLDELSARIRALLRRSAGRSEPTIERGRLSLFVLKLERFSLMENRFY